MPFYVLNARRRNTAGQQCTIQGRYTVVVTFGGVFACANDVLKGSAAGGDLHSGNSEIEDDLRPNIFFSPQESVGPELASPTGARASPSRHQGLKRGTLASGTLSRDI